MPLTPGNLVVGARCTQHTLELLPKHWRLSRRPFPYLKGLSCEDPCTAASPAIIVGAPHLNAAYATLWTQHCRPTWRDATRGIRQLPQAQTQELGLVELQLIRTATKEEVTPSDLLRAPRCPRMCMVVPVPSGYKNTARCSRVLAPVTSGLLVWLVRGPSQGKMFRRSCWPDARLLLRCACTEAAAVMGDLCYFVEGTRNDLQDLRGSCDGPHQASYP